MNDQVIKIRNLKLGDGIPKICIPLTGADKAELREQVIKLMKGHCDLVEWRADFFCETGEESWVEDSIKLLRTKLMDIPLLFTFRTGEEGGERRVSMEEYESICMKAASTGSADLVDVELNRGMDRFSRMTRSLHQMGTLVIGSFHDFSGTPEKERIIELLISMQLLGADITKVACMPQREEDVLNLLEASLEMKKNFADRPFITMSMGRLGAVSRLSGKLTGSAVTFATAGRASAPGQMEAETVSRLLSFM